MRVAARVCESKKTGMQRRRVGMQRVRAEAPDEGFLPGDIVLSRWKGFNSWAIALRNGGWSHASVVIRHEGELKLLDCSSRKWKGVFGETPPGVNVRALGSLNDARCQKWALARVAMPLSSEEVGMMRVFAGDQLARQAREGRSLYDHGGGDLAVPCLGLNWCCGPLTERTYTCVELIALCFRACGRWPRTRSVATTIPTLLATVDARIVARVDR